MGKKEMLKVPFLGMLVRPLDSILVGRDTLDSKEERGKAI
jgi:1-acyl-sn-glycerol-3-phosphate acyltransferase